MKPKMLLLAAAIVFSLPPMPAQTVGYKAVSESTVGRKPPTAIWTNPADISTLDLYKGPANEAIRPGKNFRFVKADTAGSTPKFEVIDENGTAWKVKLGEEARSETAAARLLWAIGYIADEDYFLPEMNVDSIAKVTRATKFISRDGMVHGARLERIYKDRTYSQSWSWFNNPWVGTKEFNGLRVMMALMNNWDLKKSNNAVYSTPEAEERYTVSDLGATFGKTGNEFTRSKSNVKDYARSKFIQSVDDEHVNFHLSSRPFFLSAVYVPRYIQRTKMQKVSKKVPRTHAQWVGELLGQLSAAQLRDCFRSSGYTDEESDLYVKEVQERIAELKSL